LAVALLGAVAFALARTADDLLDDALLDFATDLTCAPVPLFFTLLLPAADLAALRALDFRAPAAVRDGDSALTALFPLRAGLFPAFSTSRTRAGASFRALEETDRAGFAVGLGVVLPLFLAEVVAFRLFTAFLFDGIRGYSFIVPLWRRDRQVDPKPCSLRSKANQDRPGHKTVTPNARPEREPKNAAGEYGLFSLGECFNPVVFSFLTRHSARGASADQQAFR
jgi:hypothetical protein